MLTGLREAGLLSLQGTLFRTSPGSYGDSSPGAGAPGTPATERIAQMRILWCLGDP